LTGERQGEGVLPDAPKVLAIETGLLGELLVVTPALRALKRARPRAAVTAMVSPTSAVVLAGNPNIARLLPLPKEQRAGVAGLLRVAAWIRAQRFDAALVFHTSFRSALVAALGRVPIRAGLVSEGRGFMLTHRAPRDRDAYEVDEHLKVVAALGIPADGRALDLFLTEGERREAETHLPERAHGRPLVVVHPGASREIRCWPAGRFAELGSRLAGEREAAVVFAFGPRERDLAAELEAWNAERGLPKPHIVFPRDVRVLGALFARADVAVTNNSGPMHVAVAAGAAAVFIHGPTPVSRWQPPGEHTVPVFAEDVPCRPCDSPRCRMDSLVCMESVSVERVFGAAVGLLDVRPPA
jgi:heptosyltransferase-2